MDFNARAAYIKGMMEGMEFDSSTKEGKVIAAMMDLLSEMAAAVTEHDDALDQVYEELDSIDEDMDVLESFFDGLEIEDDEEDEDEDDEDEEDSDAVMYELTCSECGETVGVDEETLLNNDIICPKCGKPFNIEIIDEDDEDDED